MDIDHVPHAIVGLNKIALWCQLCGLFITKSSKKSVINCLIFCVAHLSVKIDIETKFPYFLFLTRLSIIRNQEFRLYI